jgi:TonB-dependent Receptor Plug Domain
MNKYRFFLAVLFFFPHFLTAQKIDSMLNIYASNYPQEKIHLQLDKKIYKAGETVWFKAYIFTGADPSLSSRNFYAELSDPSGTILERKVYPVTESSTAGSFDLPKVITSRHLHLRAYTTWMTNFDTAFYYEKDIHIFDDKLDSAGTVTVVPRESKMQFFPEGGDLIAGVETMVAFKANDQFGLPVAAKGVVQDQSGKDLLTFETLHDGMGKFLLTPDKGDSLIAVWKDDQGVGHRTGLPAPKTVGAVLRAIPGNQKVLFSVARSADGGPELKHLTIIGHMHQHLVYKARINLDDNYMSGGTIPTAQLPSGVLVLTLFDANMTPQAERVIFVNNHEYQFNPEISVQIKGVTRRGKNTLIIDVPDTIKTNMSLAVTDVTADGEFPNDDNIISRLLLTGEVRGYVHDPYFYFSGTADSLTSMLDLVMMTHGWRRIKWEALAKGQLPVIKNPEQDYLAMRVDVLGVDPARIPKDESINVILSRKDSSTQMLSVPHISGSKFGIMGLVFFDTVRAFYQFNTNRALADEAAITFSNGLVRGAKAARPLFTGFDGWTAEDSVYLKRNKYIAKEQARVQPIEDSKIKTLAAATVIGHEKSAAEKLDERYASGMFAGGDAYTFDLIDDQFALSATDIFMYLQGKVAGLQITPGQGPGGAPSLSWRGGHPLLYLNEMQVDASQLQSISVPDIAMVKVFRPGSGVGFGGGAGGTIAVYTKKGGDNKNTDPGFKGLPRAPLVGYSMPKEFYSPNYLENNANNEREDLRTTLYWKPYVLTDKDTRRVTIDFFNNDITRKLRVVLEGFSEDGKLTHLETIIQ